MKMKRSIERLIKIIILFSFHCKCLRQFPHLHIHKVEIVYWKWHQWKPPIIQGLGFYCFLIFFKKVTIQITQTVNSIEVLVLYRAKLLLETSRFSLPMLNDRSNLFIFQVQTAFCLVLSLNETRPILNRVH